MLLEISIDIPKMLTWFLLMLLSSTVTVVFGIDGTYHTMSISGVCSIAVNVKDSVTLACQYLGHINPQDTVSGSAGTQQCTSPPTVRWRRLDAHGQFTNLSTSGGKYTTWTVEALDRRKTLDSAELQSTMSFLSINGLRETDLSRYRCEVECQLLSNGRHVTRHYEATLCLRHHSAADYQLCRVDVVEASQLCDVSFSDGVCNSLCDVEQTQFDGFDCADLGPSISMSQSAAARISSTYCGDGSGRTRLRPSTSLGHLMSAGGAANAAEMKCRRSFADGVCDVDCDNAPCVWDGGDCTSRALRLTDDVMVVSWHYDMATLGGTKSPAVTPVKQLVRAVSRLLRVVVRLVNDDWLTTSDDVITGGQHDDVTLSGDTSDGREQTRTALLKVDNTNCIGRCFTTARSAALFIMAALNKGWNPGQPIVIGSVAVLERIDQQRCVLINSSWSSSAGASMFPGGGTSRSQEWQYSGGADDDTMSTMLPGVGTLFWVIVVAAVGGTVVVLLTAAVALLARQVCRGRRRQRRHRRGHSSDVRPGSRHRSRSSPGSGKAVPLSTCPSTEAETSSSVYCWNDESSSFNGRLLSPGGGAPGSQQLTAGSPRLHRYGTEV